MFFYVGNDYSLILLNNFNLNLIWCYSYTKNQQGFDDYLRPVSSFCE